MISQIYFWNKTLHVSDSSSVHHQEFFTVHTAMVYVIQLASRIRTEVRPDPACKLTPKPVWHIPLLCVQWKTTDDVQRNCLKRIEFYSKNKFEKSVHIVGFIIRIYHDARSPERHKKKACTSVFLKGGSIVGTQVTKLRAGGPGFESRQGHETFLFSKHKTNSGAHPAPYLIAIGGNFPRAGMGGGTGCNMTLTTTCV